MRAKQRGMVVSEVVTIVMAVIILAAVGFGIYVNGERKDMVESAQASIAAVVDQVAAAADDGEAIDCSNAFVDDAVLANRFLSLAIKPVPIDETDPSAGVAAGLRIRGSDELDGGDAYATASRLFEALKDDESTTLRKIRKDKDARSFEFSVLLSEQATCAA